MEQEKPIASSMMKFSLMMVAAVAALTVSNNSIVEGRMNQMNGMLNQNDIPDSGKDWISLPNGVQFQPGNSDGHEEDEVRLDNLRKLAFNGFQNGGRNGDEYSTNPQLNQAFIDGSETYYNEYAQAWRLLGWYIDCDSCEMAAEGQGGNDNNNNAGFNDNFGSCWAFRAYNGYEDNQNANADNNNNDKQNQNRSGCQRYLIWAAVSYSLSLCVCVYVDHLNLASTVCLLFVTTCRL